MNIHERICGAILLPLTIAAMWVAHEATYQNTRNAFLFAGVVGVISLAVLMGRGFDAHPPEQDGK